MQNIFTYGSLMFTEVWTRVATQQYRTASGILQGFARNGVIGADYPVIFPDPAAPELSGVVHFEVSQKDLELLDVFEGEYYRRQQVDIRLADNSLVEAGVYVLRPRYHHIASGRPWSADQFRTTGIKNFLTRYKGFT